MKFNRLVSIVVFFFLVVSGLYALTSLQYLLPNIAAETIMPLSKAKTTIWAQNEDSEKELRSGSISSSWDQENKYWTVNTVDELSTSSLRVSAQGELINFSVATKDQRQIKRNKYDHLTIQKSSARQYVFSKSLQQKKEQPSIHNLTEKEVLFAVLPYQVQRLLKAKVKDGVNLDLVITNNLSVNFDLAFMAVDPNKPLPGKYDFPKAFLDSLKQHSSLNVIETGATGIAGLIYPHKFYLAFGPAPDYLPLASWGGEPGKDFFQVSEL